MLAKKMKRTLAFLLSLVMVLGLLPVSAFAVYTSSAQQVVEPGGTRYYDNNGKPQQQKDGDTAVEVTKTVKAHADGAENHFTVDLSVTAYQHMDKISYSEDSAVVLVMDVSGSMDDNMPCPVCGKTSSHKSGCSEQGKGFQTRLDAARSAALSFLKSYHNSAKDENETVLVARHVAIMKFADKGNRVLEWVDAATDEGYTKAVNAINGLTKANGGTNIEAGLLLARNNLNIAPKSDGKNIESRYVVLLTDGKAETSCSPLSDQDDDLTSVTALGEAALFPNPKPRAESAAKRVKGTAGAGAYQDSALLYTVACGGADAKWLRESIASSSKTALTAGNTAELEAAFTMISNSIKTWAEAWVVTDPMGANMTFTNDLDADGFIPNTQAKFNASNNTLTWDLKQEPLDGAAADGSSFTYRLSYDIVLDTTGLSNSNPQPTNGPTTLTYIMVDDNGGPLSDTYTASFPIPTVKGQFGSFGFQKLSAHTVGADQKHEPLKDAVFTLTHAADCACGLAAPAVSQWTAISRDSGAVEFTTVPSGHTYTLQETEAPVGYVVSDAKYQVSSSWGKVLVDEKTWDQNKDQVLNTLDPKSVTVTVTKYWQDSAAPELRPAPKDFLVTLTGSDNSTYTVTDWTQDESVWSGTVQVPTVDVTTGLPISYDVTETVPSGYTLAAGSKTVVWAPDGSSGIAELTNTLKVTVPVTVTKVWLAPDNMIPKSIDVTLYASETKSYPLTLTGPDWSETVEVDLYDGGSKLEYSVREHKPEGFSDPLYQGDMTHGFTITNAVEQEYLTISGTKTWIGEKPEAPQTVTLTGDNGYSATVDLTGENTSFQFTKVPKYDINDDYTGTGKEIVYTVSDEVEGFTKAQADVTITGSTGTATLTNIRDNIDDTITITAEKVWADEDNANHTRPAQAIPVTLQRLEGETWTKVRTDAFTPGTDGEGVITWTDAVFSGIPKFDPATGTAYQYKVEEAQVDNYLTTYANPAIEDDGSLTFTVTNTLDSGKDGATTSVTVTKVWKDPYTDASREAEAVITLTGSNGYTDTWTTSRNESHIFSDLPLYADGAKVIYTAEEQIPEGYTSQASQDGLTFTNTIAQAKRDITVTKVWEDDFTDPANRPDITISLYRNGDENDIAASVAGGDMTKLNDDTYRYTFTDLETYDLTTGKPIGYQVMEEVKGTNAGRFFPEFSGNAKDGFTVTNAFTDETTTVSGDKVWVRPTAVDLPASVTIAVYGVDKKTPVDTQEITAGGDGKWSYSFTGLPKYDSTNGNLINYTVAELTVPAGWTSAVSTEDHRTITNTSDVLNDTVSYTVTKSWVGPKSDIPDELVIDLYRDGMGEPVESYALTAKEGWAHTFTLPKYVGTEPAVYSAKERDSIEQGGKLFITGKALTYEVTSTSTENGTAFTNTVLQDNTVAVAGEKSWSGAPVAFTAPEITVELWADNAKLKEQAVGKDGDWTFSFETLPKYALDNEGDGHEIVYTVREKDAAAGTILFIQNGEYYYFTVTGGAAGSYDLTNTFDRKDTYSYRVMGDYTVNIDGSSVGSMTLELEPAKNAGKNASISRSPEEAAKFTAPIFPADSALAAYSGKTFTYQEKGSKPTVKLEKSGQVYDIVLKYTYDLTTTSYTVNHEYYLDGQKQDYLEGDTHTYSQGVYVGGIVNADSIEARNSRGGVNYSLTGRTPDTLTLDADAAKNVFTFTYSYTTPPTPTFTLTVNHVDLEENEAHKDIFQDGTPKTYKITETATASPLTAETGLPAGYKLVKTSQAVDDKISFDENGMATVRGSDGEALAITYYYGAENTVLITINYLRNDADRTPISELPKKEISDYKSYDAYDVTEFIYKPAAGEHGQYTYVTDSTKTEAAPDGVYAGTLGTENLVIDVLYDVEPYPYKVVFHNDYTGTVLATVSSSDMMAEYGTVLTSEDLGVWFPDSVDWVNTYRPGGYNAGTVTYPASVGYSPNGKLTTDPTSGEEIWDHSPITNIVEVHYGYTPSGGGDDNDPTPSRYRITINYLEDGTDEELAAPYTKTYSSGSSYNVTDQAQKAIPGYTIVRTSGAPVEGRINRSLTINVYYAETVNIPDDPTPEGDKPGGDPVTPPPADGGGSTPDGGIDIPDGDVPMGDGSFIPNQGGDGTGTDTDTGTGQGGDGSSTIILDDDIPMGDLPQTGTVAPAADPTTTLGYLALAASMAAAGLAFVISRKKEDEA